MLFSVHRDLASGHLVRCFAPLPNKSYGVGGAGFSIGQALAKCRSEYAERLFVIDQLAPQKIRPIGIAAHPHDPSQAFQSSKLEVLESLMLEAIKQTGQVEGFRIVNSLSFSLSICSVSGIGYFAALRTIFKGKPLLSYSARRTLGATLLKVWEESRNPHFHKCSIEDMATFSKSTRLFSDEEIRGLDFRHSTRSIDAPHMEHIEFNRSFYRGHHIAYAVQRQE